MSSQKELWAAAGTIIAVSLMGVLLGQCVIAPLTRAIPHRSTLRELCEQRGGVLVDLGHDDGYQCFSRSAVIDDLGRD
jgi:hypothetical protein